MDVQKDEMKSFEWVSAVRSLLDSGLFKHHYKGQIGHYPTYFI